jgi:predicted phage tail protein
MHITVKYIPNILERSGRQVRQFIPLKEKRTAWTWIKRAGFSYKECRVIINGFHVPNNELRRTYVKAGDEIIVTPKVEIPAVIGVMSAIWGAIVSVAVWAITVHPILTLMALASIGYSIYSSVSASRKKVSSDTGETSTAYTFSGPQMTSDVGGAIPVIYGRFGAAGNILNQYVSHDGEKSYLNILISIGQGEIESISGIMLNNNSVNNYTNVTINTRMGTSDQTPITGFEQLHNEYVIDVTLLKDTPHVRQTINDDVDTFEITFQIPGIYRQNSDSGALESWSISYRVEYKLSTSGTWTDCGITTITAKSQSAINRTFRKTGLTPGRYDIRVTRTSDDPNESNQTYGTLNFYILDEIQSEELSYPNLALVGIQALATDQLDGNRPSFYCVVEGRKISAPLILNGATPVDWEDYYYDPDVSAYRLLSDDTVLSWDGVTYTEQFCANPIWVVKDLLTNNRFGIGDFIDTSNINTAEYLYMSQVCEQKMADGNGGYEKLYRIDAQLDSQDSALDILTQLAAAFDAFIFYNQDTVRIKIDEDEDPVQMFGMGNTYQGSLKQTWKSLREKFNCIDVQFANKDNYYNLETVSIMDDEALQRGDPLRRTSVRLYTTGISYVLRAGRRALNVAQRIDEIFTFKAGIDGIACMPGDVIGLSHDTPGIGFSGRIKTGSSTMSIKLDQEVTIEAGKTYKLLVQFAGTDLIVERSVTNTPGTTDTITVDTAFASAPAAYDKYAFGEDQIHYKKLRVSGFKMDTDLDVEITASEMDPLVYDYSAPSLPEVNYSVLTRTIPSVTNLALSEMVLKANDGTIFNTIEVYFTKPVAPSYYLNPYKSAKIYISDNAGLSWEFAGETSDAHFTIKDGIQTGVTYTIAVVSVAQSGAANLPAGSPQSSIIIQGKAAPPSNISSIDVYQKGNKLVLRVSNPIPDGDLARYQWRQGVDWDSATVVAELVDSTQTEITVGAIGELTFLCKAIDTSGNYSALPASDTLTVVPPPEGDFAMTLDLWAQNREYKLTNVDRIQLNLYDPNYTRDVFVLKTQNTWQDVEGQNWDGLDFGAQLVEATGEIEEVHPIDLGVIFEFTLLVSPLIQNAAGGSLSVEISTSEDGTSFTAFSPIDLDKTYRARYIKRKFVLSTTDTTQQVYFYAERTYVTAPTAKQFPFRDVSIAAGGTTILLRDDFTQIPRVRGLTVTNGVLGVPHLVSITTSEMVVKVWDPVSASYIGTAEVSGEVVGA